MDTGAAWRRWLLEEVRSAGRRLRALEERLDEATLCRRGLVGAWSGTELLVHLARWDEATVAVV
ncbi:MAG TPA: hypothetical protein VE152_13960, partial [Acidimicrobiales bacterium]|nr:hypothetical protein [Acidimicrobiales bacterium]